MLNSMLSVVVGCVASFGDDVAWSPHTSKTSRGESVAGRVGRLTLPERHAAPDGPTLELACVVYETKHVDPGPPIYILVGGPGAAGIDYAAEVATDPRLRLLDRHDIVGIDQRGTGRCLPNLSQAPRFGYELPFDRPITRDDVEEAMSDAVRRCMAHWADQGVDVGAYNTRESAHDVEALRDALGHDEIILWGTSYGSHLALACLRQHPEHIARAMLFKVEGPDDTYKLPSAVQSVLEQVADELVEHETLGDDVPDLLGSIEALLAQLAEEPETLELPPQAPVPSVVLGPFDLQSVLAMSLGHTPNIARLPQVIDALEDAQWSMLASMAVRNRMGEVGSAMALGMDTASGLSDERRQRILEEAADPANLTGDAINAPWFPSVGDACGEIMLDDEFRAPFSCDVPVLFVSGAMDARTPPLNVEAIAAGFSDHAHLIVERTGHDSRELESELFCDLAWQFLEEEPIESQRIPMPPIEFAPLFDR